MPKAKQRTSIKNYDCVKKDGAITDSKRRKKRRAFMEARQQTVSHYPHDKTGFDNVGDEKRMTVIIEPVNDAKLTNYSAFVNVKQLDNNGELPEQYRRNVYGLTPFAANLGGNIEGIGRSRPTDDDVFGRRYYLIAGFGYFKNVERVVDGERVTERVVDPGPLISKHHQKMFMEKCLTDDVREKYSDYGAFVTDFFWHVDAARRQIALAMFESEDVHASICTELVDKAEREVDVDPDAGQDEIDAAVNTHAFFEYEKRMKWADECGITPRVVEQAIYTAALFDVKYTSEIERVVEGNYADAAEKLCDERIQKIKKEFKVESSANEDILTAFIDEIVALQFNGKILDYPTPASKDVAAAIKKKKQTKRRLNVDAQERLSDVEQKRDEIDKDPTYADLREFEKDRLAQRIIDEDIYNNLIGEGVIYKEVVLRRHGIDKSELHHGQSIDDVLWLQRDRESVFDRYEGFGPGTVLRLKFSFDPYATKDNAGIRLNFHTQKNTYPIIVVDYNAKRERRRRSVENYGELGAPRHVADDDGRDGDVKVEGNFTVAVKEDAEPSGANDDDNDDDAAVSDASDDDGASLFDDDDDD